MMHPESQADSPSLATTFTHLVLELKPPAATNYPFECQNAYNPVTLKDVSLTALVIEALKVQIPELETVEESLLLRVDLSVEVLEQRSLAVIPTPIAAEPDSLLEGQADHSSPDDAEVSP